jgi:hypothetical protein
MRTETTTLITIVTTLVTFLVAVTLGRGGPVEEGEEEEDVVEEGAAEGSCPTVEYTAQAVVQLLSTIHLQ